MDANRFRALATEFLPGDDDVPVVASWDDLPAYQRRQVLADLRAVARAKRAAGEELADAYDHAIDVLARVAWT